MNTNRWRIAVAGFFMQLVLGAVYAWSVFRNPLVKQFGWSISEVTLTFTISIFMLGIAAFFGGLWLKRTGPRIVAILGGLMFGVGVFLASLSNHGLWWLYLSYGVIGGIGVGLGYIVPVPPSPAEAPRFPCDTCAPESLPFQYFSVGLVDSTVASNRQQMMKSPQYFMN